MLNESQSAQGQLIDGHINNYNTKYVSSTIGLAILSPSLQILLVETNYIWISNSHSKIKNPNSDSERGIHFPKGLSFFHSISPVCVHYGFVTFLVKNNNFPINLYFQRKFQIS